MPQGERLQKNSPAGKGAGVLDKRWARHTRPLFACAACLTVSSEALAQPRDEKDEITVTAQRREEAASSIPIAITVLSGDMAQARGVLGTADIAAVAPGLTYNNVANAATPFIRGVGAQLVAIGSEPSVATYLDDFYIPQGSAALFQLNGARSISVLRGPQGTLFGRNATGGVVQIRTRDPAPEPAGEIAAGYANYDAPSTEAYLTGPITPTLTGNVAAYFKDQRGGWGRDLVTGEETFTAQDYGARGKLLWTPWEGGQFLLSATYNYTSGEQGLGAKPIPGSPFRSILTDLAAIMPELVPRGGFFDTYDAPLNDETVTEWRAASLRFEQDLGWAQFVSITGWQRQRGHAFFNQEGSPLAIVYVQIFQADDNRTQEFQLLSPEDSRLRWLLGTFLYWDKAGYDPTFLRGAAFGFPDALGPDMLVIDNAVTTKSFAIYGQATAEIGPATNLTFGVRYTVDERTARGGLSSVVSSVVTPITSDSPSREASWDAFTYRAALDHRFGQDLMAYASYNRGFKSGVFDMFGFSQPGIDPLFPDGRALTARPAEPEVLDAYEIGAKAALFDQALRVNVAAFYNDFKNIQVLQIVTGGTRIHNAGAAEIKGVEIDVAASPTDRLTLTGGLSAMHGEYTDFPLGPRWMNNAAPFPAPPLIAVDSDLTGNATIHTPRLTTTFGIGYTVPTSMGDVDLNLAHHYNDGFFWEPDNSVDQPSFHLVNGSIVWRSPSEAFSMRLWARNLLNERYYSWASTSGVGAYFSPAAPRTFGVELSYRWGE